MYALSVVCEEVCSGKLLWKDNYIPGQISLGAAQAPSSWGMTQMWFWPLVRLNHGYLRDSQWYVSSSRFEDPKGRDPDD